MRYAIIDDGRVANVALAEDPDFAAEQGWIEAPIEVAIGWLYTDGEFAAPQHDPIPLDELRDIILDRLAARRWIAETGGIVAHGAPIKTDRESQSVLTGAFVQASANPAFTVRWKVGRGAFVTLDAATIVALGNAVTSHVQACFNREDELTGDILAAFAAGDREALEAIDLDAGWPG